ncbi:MAG: hypothetical protein PVJ55_00660 [Anaerolineae bacterium]|jgi:hypothetical protein
MNERDHAEQLPLEEEAEEFDELIRYTVVGFVGGLLLGGVFDSLGLQRSPVGQGLVRTVSGEGESLLEGLFALRKRLGSGPAGMAEAYGWGKLVGMTLPWWIDAASRALGVDVYGVSGFYIPYFYALSDQIGANVSGLLFLRRRSGSWDEAVTAYVRHPVMIASLSVILIAPLGLLLARLLGFSPSTQVLTALETIASNLCWIPPTVGWLRERRRARQERDMYE